MEESMLTTMTTTAAAAAASAAAVALVSFGQDFAMGHELCSF